MPIPPALYKTKVVLTEEETREVEKSPRNQAENKKWVIEQRKKVLNFVCYLNFTSCATAGMAQSTPTLHLPTWDAKDSLTQS